MNTKNWVKPWHSALVAEYSVFVYYMILEGGVLFSKSGTTIKLVKIGESWVGFKGLK